MTLLERSIYTSVLWAGKTLKAGVFILCFLSVAGLRAQDPHFSQQFHAPLYLNPALTGNISDGDMRIAMTYRGQWYHLSSTPYHTFLAAWDKRWCRGRDFFGTGLMFMGDLAGSPAITTIHGKATVAYQRLVGSNISLALGAEGGYIRRGIDLNGLQFDAQFNGREFDPGLDSFEEFNNTPAQAFDLGAGGLVQVDFDSPQSGQRSVAFFGFSLQHLNRPVLRFKDKELFKSNQIAITNRVKMNAHLGGQFFFTKDHALLPRALFMIQGKNQWEAFAGLEYKYQLSIQDNYFAVGVGYRRVNYYQLEKNAPDALVITTTLDFKQSRLGLSYDYTLSELRQLTGWLGTFELAFIQTFSTGWGRQQCETLSCPLF